jgi:hypothetical protein
LTGLKTTHYTPEIRQLVFRLTCAKEQSIRMPKKTDEEKDESKLKTKLRQRLEGHANPEGDAALRALHKRLKRGQRKRRALAARKARAAGAPSAEQK